MTSAQQTPGNAIRIRRGLSANLVAIGTRVAVQLATLPILFANWDAEAVGIWLILFAIPSYVALVGNGIAGAGGTAALASAASGDMDRARSDFAAAWGISAGSTAALALVFAGSAMFLVPSVVERGGDLDMWDVAQATAWLALYVFATSQMGIFDIPYRAVGRYPDHLLLYNAASLLEIVVLAAAVTFFESFAVLAMALALFRCLAAVWIWASARKAAPAMFDRTARNGSAKASLRALWLPSLAFMIMQLTYGLNLQGYLLLVGAAFGPVVVAGFAATRVLTRVLDWVCHLVYAMQYYESGYLGDEKREVQRRLLATMTLVSLAIAAVFAAGLLLLGPWMQALYTVGETRFDTPVAIVLLLTVSMRALSMTPMAFVASENAHSPIAVTHLAGSAVALALAVLLAMLGASLPVVLLPLLLAEAAQLIPAMRRALAMLDLTIRDFARSLIASERWDDIVIMWRTALRKG